MKISLSSIVKNEANHIGQCLESVKGIDEIVICDTGSEDNTIEIVKQYTDKVFTDYIWNDNFAEARNHVLAKCTGDWILIVDADETLLTPVEELYKAIEESEKNGFITIRCNVKAKNSNQTHRQPRLFKNCPENYWKGAIHNCLSNDQNNEHNITIEYGYSDAHKKDPDRALRILTKVVNETPTCSREKYYLAREYWYRKDYKTALDWYEIYLKTATWAPEKADGFLMAARCAWFLQQGDYARELCMNAIIVNANFKEALLFMGEMSWEHNKKKWIEFAQLADNSNVLFIRA